MNPAGAPDLVNELSKSVGRFALVVDGPSASQAVAACRDLLDEPAVSVGSLLTEAETPPTAKWVEQVLRSKRLLIDLDVLFWPELRVDPLALLSRISRASGGHVALWPGRLVQGRASYSALGRSDYYDRDMSDALVLRPIDRAFPDEPSFAIERWRA